MKVNWACSILAHQWKGFGEALRRTIYAGARRIFIASHSRLWGDKYPVGWTRK
jgi:hypothetical protein